MPKNTNCFSLYSGVMPKLPTRSFFKLLLLGYYAGHAHATGNSKRRETYNKFVDWMKIDKLTYDRTSFQDHIRFGQRELKQLKAFIDEKENCYQLYALSNFDYDLEQALIDQMRLTRFLKPTNALLCEDAGAFMILGIMHVIRWTFIGYYHAVQQTSKFRELKLIVADFEKWLRVPGMLKIKLTEEDYKSFLTEMDILKRFSNINQLLKPQ